MRYRWLLWMWVTLPTLLSVGCSTLFLNPWKSSSAPGHNSSPQKIHLSYRTDSGRLNRMNAGRDETQLASFEQPSAMPVPPFSYGTLTIDYPHPRGVRGYALVTATFAPEPDTNQERWSWSTLFGSSEKSTEKKTSAREVWETEIPRQHVENLIGQLKDKQFFRRVRVLGSEVHIETDINGKQMSKEFPAVGDLDALLLNIRRVGKSLSATPIANSGSRESLPMNGTRPNGTSPNPTAQPQSFWPPEDLDVRRLPTVIPPP